MENFKSFCHVASLVFSGMCVGYTAYALITFIYCKWWRDDVPWFNLEDFCKFSTKYWIWVYIAFIIPLIIDICVRW
jgi:xanthine/uracil permease